MKMYAFDGPDFHFWVATKEQGEEILDALGYRFGGVDEEEYTATEIDVVLK